MYLIDTNVISEARKGLKSNLGVQQFFSSIDSENLYISVQTIGEIRQGIENIRYRGDQQQANKLEKWFNLLNTEYANKILGFDEVSAQLWGKLLSPNHQHPVDKQIAAIALIHDLTVVTRNTADFSGTGVALINPFV